MPEAADSWAVGTGKEAVPSPIEGGTWRIPAIGVINVVGVQASRG